MSLPPQKSNDSRKRTRRLTVDRAREKVKYPWHKAIGTHFEPQRASVRAGRPGVSCKSGPHASALRLKIYKVSAIWHKAIGMKLDD